MSTIDDTVQRLRALAREIGIAELARRAGVADSTLRQIFEPGWNPRRSTLTACARVLEPGACGAGDPHPGLPPHAGASGVTGPLPDLPPLKAGEGEGEEVSDAA